MYIKYIFAAEVIFKNTFILKAVHLQIIISNSGHYQSIQPSENNQIIRHYRWTKNRSQSRLCSVGEPIGCSSRISSKKQCYDEKECGEQSSGKRPCLSTYDTSDAMESIIGSSSRKIATGCHICSNLFKKNAVKKKRMKIGKNCKLDPDNRLFLQKLFSSDGECSSLELYDGKFPGNISMV